MAKTKSNKKVWVVLSILLLAIIAIVYYISNKKNDTISINTDIVSRRTISQTVSAIGKIEAETEVKISSQTSGEVIYLGVKEGDTVKTNQLVARIKPDIIDAQLKQMEASAEASKMDIATRDADMTRLKSELSRITDLYKKEFASKREMETAQAAYDQAVSGYKASLARYQQALAMLQQTKREQERTSIFTPIGGIVTSLPIELGEKVVGTGMMAGTEMMKVSDLSVMNAVVEVDENDITHVSVGDTAVIEVDAISFKKYKGIVIEIGHSAISSQQGTQDQVINFKVKVRFIDSEAKLRPGMSCSVDIITETKVNTISAPLQAVTVRDTKLDRQPDVDNRHGAEEEIKQPVMKDRPQSVVFLFKNGKAKMQNVETGISDKGYIEILSGLSDGDKIISGPFMAISQQLKDGDMVKVDTTMNKFNKK
ncbi:MAG TPA: efflux RND transporter periplasmic adaptor subunit [Candidatus Kapabacteria bacterium]|nr:efflux RND transporter periplasmic adaptor subunit [Candidatus Kapabacteria bacterium]